MAPKPQPCQKKLLTHASRDRENNGVFKLAGERRGTGSALVGVGPKKGGLVEAPRGEFVPVTTLPGPTRCAKSALQPLSKENSAAFGQEKRGRRSLAPLSSLVESTLLGFPGGR
jgi:hypothetical protein